MAAGSERCLGDGTFAEDEDEAARFLAELVCTQRVDVSEECVAPGTSLQRIGYNDHEDDQEDVEDDEQEGYDEDDNDCDQENEEDASMILADQKRKSSSLCPLDSNGSHSKRLITNFFRRPNGSKFDSSYAAARRDAKALTSRQQARDKNGRVASVIGGRKAEGKENERAGDKRQLGEKMAGVKWRGRFTSKPSARSEGWRKTNGPNEWQQIPGTSFLVVSVQHDARSIAHNLMSMLICAFILCTQLHTSHGTVLHR